MTGRPIFDYPPERRAPEGEGCITCGIILCTMDCGDPLPDQDREQNFRTCKRCAASRRQVRLEARKNLFQ